MGADAGVLLLPPLLKAGVQASELSRVDRKLESSRGMQQCDVLRCCSTTYVSQVIDLICSVLSLPLYLRNLPLYKCKDNKTLVRPTEPQLDRHRNTSVFC